MPRNPMPRPRRGWLLAAAACALAVTVARAAADADRHLVRDGDTLESIAAAHGVTVGDLLTLNPALAAAGVVHVGQTPGR